MAFSFRKILSNINYFNKPGEEGFHENETIDSDMIFNNEISAADQTENLNFQRLEPDSTSKLCSSLKLPETVKTYTAKKGSFSDTDIISLSIDSQSSKLEKRKTKKLKIDMKKAKSIEIGNSGNNTENTPKHYLLDNKSSEAFSEKLKGFDFNQSFDLFDAMSEGRPSSPEKESDIDIESLPENTDTESITSDAPSPVKMCRKVDSKCENINHIIQSYRTTPESFVDLEIDRNEEERISTLINYQSRLEKLEHELKKILSEFRLHIIVSKIFHSKSIVSTGMDEENIPKFIGEIACFGDVSRSISPMGEWNVILEREDSLSKLQIEKQLLMMKHAIEIFVKTYLHNQTLEKRRHFAKNRSLIFNIYKEKKQPAKRQRLNMKKKIKHFDFPDLRDAMINLFNPEIDAYVSGNDLTHVLSEIDESDLSKCGCRCRCHSSPSSDTDSGLLTKSNDRSLTNQSITSSIGNFSLDASTLSAYSDSLDQIISYNSFQDTSLYSTILQKAAIERITFYVQVHSIQLKCESKDEEFETKNIITFHCPSCKSTENEENGLLKHILSQRHCEKIHFLYKTAYIKSCMSTGKEIQPSTVLNPMTMYRDENKIVCFGDAMYACSLCFENLIVGESVLMAHCSEQEHLERKDKLMEILG